MSTHTVPKGPIDWGSIMAPVKQGGIGHKGRRALTKLGITTWEQLGSLDLVNPPRVKGVGPMTWEQLAAFRSRYVHGIVLDPAKISPGTHPKPPEPEPKPVPEPELSFGDQRNKFWAEEMARAFTRWGLWPGSTPQPVVPPPAAPAQAAVEYEYETLQGSTHYSGPGDSGNRSYLSELEINNAIEGGGRVVSARWGDDDNIWAVLIERPKRKETASG